MAHIHCRRCDSSRRDFLRSGLFGLGIGALVPSVFGETSFSIAAQAAQTGREANRERILVVVELNGGNDGLDTVIPWNNDSYRKARPTLAAAKTGQLKASEEYCFHSSLGGLKKLWDDGVVAVIHGCGYPNPDRSHFTSMEYWHTGTPHQPQTTGWVGRFADTLWPQAPANTIVNITPKQSLAVQAERHSPVIFNNPEDFVRAGDKLQSEAYRQLIAQKETGNAALDFLTATSRTAADSSQRVREVVRNYKTPVAYGSTPLAQDLRKVAALVESRFPTRIYYVSLAGFDTHAGQQSGRFYLLTGLGEGLRAFHDDLRRMKRNDDVAVMMFSEFGRRVEENASAGTDHGTAGPMFIFGSRIKAGFHGTHPSLADLDQNGDLKMTMDFRRVYATMIKEWMGFGDSGAVLKGDFAPLGIFV